jgi:hypothetical protein
MDTTRLDELPVHNNSTAALGGGGGVGNNIVMQQYDPNMIPNGGGGGGGPDPRQLAMNGAPSPGIDPRTLNELVSGVQRASGAGMTSLPSRDIPRDSLSMQHDDQIKPNYIPRDRGHGQGQGEDDYIARYESTDEVRENNRRSKNKSDTLETLYTEFQMPILIGVVYFMFQMPALRTAIMQFLPSMFNKDGNMNLQGLVSMSVLYAVAYYTLTKIINAAEGL